VKRCGKCGQDKLLEAFHRRGSDREKTCAACKKRRRAERSTKKPSRSAYYIPTPEQIREACLTIQAEWTEQERLERCGHRPWTVTRAHFGGEHNENHSIDLCPVGGADCLG
jgi:hypothetical protein